MRSRKFIRYVGVAIFLISGAAYLTATYFAKQPVAINVTSVLKKQLLDHAPPGTTRPGGTRAEEVDRMKREMDVMLHDANRQAAETLLLEHCELLETRMTTARRLLIFASVASVLTAIGGLIIVGSTR